MKPRLYWRPTKTATWELMFDFEYSRRIAVVQRSVSGGWEVPVSGGSYLFARRDLDDAVDKAEQEGCRNLGLAPGPWRLERVRRLRALTTTHARSGARAS